MTEEGAVKGAEKRPEGTTREEREKRDVQREREIEVYSERERQTDRQADRQTDRE